MTAKKELDPKAAWPFPTKGEEASGNTGEALEDYKVGPFDDDDDPDAPVTVSPFEELQAPGDRIRPNAINLYADPAQNVVQLLGSDMLVDSPFNPRNQYNQKALQELAETIRGVGIEQALLVRPMGEAKYEIVFGHRRVRAARLADLAEVPCIVRDLSDAQAAQLQAIENVQREDLDALEEAAGYQHYLQAHGVSKDVLAQEVGLSKSHVYGRLKLLEAVPAVQESLRKGEIQDEVALYIARLPTAKMQEKALGSLQSNHIDITDGGRPSVRRIREFLREKFSLGLKEAIFDKEDAALVPDAGPCTTCPKKAGNSPIHTDLAETIKGRDRWGHTVTDRGQPDLCTDPDCFEAKKKAHLKNKASELEAKGKTVITGGKARSAISAEGQVKNGYVALKDVKDQLAKAREKKGEDAPAIAPVIIQNPRNGKTVEAVKVEDLKAVGIKVKEPSTPRGSSGGYDYEAERARQEADRRKRELKAKAEATANRAILDAVRQAAAGVPYSDFALRLVATAALSGVQYEARTLLAELHDCKDFGKLQKAVDSTMPADRLTTLILDAAIVDHVIPHPYSDEKPRALLAAANHYGIDVEAIRKASTPEPEPEPTRPPAAEAAAPAKAKKTKDKAPTPKTPKATKGKKGSPTFLASLTPSPELAVIVGAEPIPRTEIVSKLWAYIKKNKLQDGKNKRAVNADANLQAVFGKAQVSMFEMASLIGKHVT